MRYTYPSIASENLQEENNLLKYEVGIKNIQYFST